MLDDAYALLEVQSTASVSEVRAAYHRLATLFHPDRNPGFQEAANQRLREINEAYELIRAAKRKRLVDDEPANSRARDESSGEDAAEPAPEADDAAARARISAMLTRLGFLTDTADPQDEAVVEIVASFLPRGAEICACISYRELHTTGTPKFSSRTSSFLRAVPLAPFGEALGASTARAPIGAVAPTRIALCTRGGFLWTTSRILSTDGVVAEESVTACVIPMRAVLGAGVTGRRKEIVDIWLEDGSKLAFRARPNAARALCEHVDEVAGTI